MGAKEFRRIGPMVCVQAPGGHKVLFGWVFGFRMAVCCNCDWDLWGRDLVLVHRAAGLHSLDTIAQSQLAVTG